MTVGQMKTFTKKLAKAAGTADRSKYVLKLYITGATPRSTKAIMNIRQICEEHLKGRYELEIIDIFQTLNLAGLTIAMVTHESDIAQYARRVIVFRDGKIRKDERVAAPPRASEVLKTMPTLED